MRFKHLLFSRFNLTYKSTKIKPYSERVVEMSKKFAQDPRWLSDRLDFFETYCLPSVRGQTTQNFKWYLLFSDMTSDKFDYRLGKYVNENTEVSYNYLGDHDIVYDEIAYQIKKAQEEGGELDYIITTNLDCDDAISKNFMKEVQKNFKGRKEFLNIPSGFIYDVRIEKAFTRSSEHSPFRSFVQPVSDIDEDLPIEDLYKHDKHTIYARIHGDSKSMAPIRQVETSARWLQLIHTENLTNKIARRSQDKGFPLEDIADIFGVKSAV